MFFSFVYFHLCWSTSILRNLTTAMMATALLIGVKTPCELLLGVSDVFANFSWDTKKWTLFIRDSTHDGISYWEKHNLSALTFFALFEVLHFIFHLREVKKIEQKATEIIQEMKNRNHVELSGPKKMLPWIQCLLLSKDPILSKPWNHLPRYYQVLEFPDAMEISFFCECF